ncbi:hypothetical protein OG381_03035 [Streptomyces sp. NBC_00490]|uniref:hypothetical protein n=1 Tax=Streptomyces sp. NBC_00490 TaxID=2903657 RepID=UPI0030E1909F
MSSPATTPPDTQDDFGVVREVESRVDQTPAAAPGDPAARERRRRQLVAGAYPLVCSGGAKVTIPLVAVLDGHPHTLAFLATVNRVPISSLGVTRFGQSGGLEDVYRHHGLDADSIVRAALDLTA